METNTKSFRADWVIPVDRPPIRDGVVLVKNDSIMAVDRYQSKEHRSSDLVDLGAAAIIPGLVNAHTHLEFGYLSKPLGEPGIPFTDWIRKIVNSRNESNQQPAEKATVIRQGLLESFRSGVWCVGDIATTPVNVEQYTEKTLSPAFDQITKVVFYEQLGRMAAHFPEKIEQLATILGFADDSQLLSGISPHAPYSVHPGLLDLLCDVARGANLPLAMHLAETEAERELLLTQTGPFVGLLQEFGVWDESSFLPTTSILDYLKVLARGPRSLVIHGNYLQEDEIEFVASVRARMSIVFCPRTHQFFGHARYPLHRLLQARICLAIGTDSRASNPDLDLFQELKCVSRSFPEIPKSEILKMGTLNGARALGVDRDLGSLSCEKRAALSYVRCPEESVRNGDPFDWIFENATTCAPLI